MTVRTELCEIVLERRKLRTSMKIEKNMAMTKCEAGDWAETPREKEFVLNAIRDIPKRFGVTPDMVSRHIIGLDKRDGLKELLNQRVRESMRRRRLGRPPGDAELRKQMEQEKAVVAARVNELALKCVTIAAAAAGAPAEKVIGRWRTPQLLEARWMAVLAVYELMEFKSMEVLRKTFGMHYDTVKHIRRSAKRWPRRLKDRLNKVIEQSRHISSRQ